MHIGPENVVDAFLRKQAEILYASANKPLPDYASMMLTIPTGIFVDDSSSFDGFASRDLQAVRSGRHLCPDEHEIGTEALKAYEAAQQLAIACIRGIESNIVYGGQSNERRESRPEDALNALRAARFSLMMGEHIYRKVDKPSAHFPLRELYDTALDRVSCAERAILQGALASRASELDENPFAGIVE